MWVCGVLGQLLWTPSTLCLLAVTTVLFLQGVPKHTHTCISPCHCKLRGENCNWLYSNCNDVAGCFHCPVPPARCWALHATTAVSARALPPRALSCCGRRVGSFLGNGPLLSRHLKKRLTAMLNGEYGGPTCNRVILFSIRIPTITARNTTLRRL